MKHTGPYTIHIRFEGNRRNPEPRTSTYTRKTFKAAENVLTAFNFRVTARWIENASGTVFSPYAITPRETTEA